MANVLLNVNNDTGSPEMVQNHTDTLLSISSPDAEVGGAGSWDVAGCSVDITAVEASATAMVAIVTGSIACDTNATPPQILTRPIPISGVPDTTVTITTPLTFRTAIGLLG